MTPEEKALDLIYGAAIQPSLWVDVMQQLMSLIGGEGGVLMRANIKDGMGAATLANGDPGTVDSYFSHYAMINPFQLVPDPEAYVKGWSPRILLDEDWVPREDFERSEYYNDFLRPLSAEWGLAIRLSLRGFDLATISIGRGFKYGRFESAEIAAMGRLQPHLIRAFTLSEQFAALQGLKTGLADALNLCPSAMFVLQGNARILHANAAAESLLTQGDSVYAAGGRLCAFEADENDRLSALLARAGTGDWEQRSAGSFAFQGRGRRSLLNVSATPIRLEEVSVFSVGSAVLLCITSPVGVSPAFNIKLAERFALTKAESRLAFALYEGSTLREASLHSGISINTARVQLSSIFAKTATRRQADLIRLLMSDGGMKPGAAISR